MGPSTKHEHSGPAGQPLSSPQMDAEIARLLEQWGGNDEKVATDGDND